MKRFQSKRLVVPARKFDRYEKPWPADVTTVVGDVGIPHPVLVTVQGNMNLNSGDWIIYLTSGPITMPDALFHTLFEEHALQLELSVGIGEPIKESDHGKS